jgi:hypothetical protein
VSGTLATSAASRAARFAAAIGFVAPKEARRSILPKVDPRRFFVRIGFEWSATASSAALALFCATTCFPARRSRLSAPPSARDPLSFRSPFAVARSKKPDAFVLNPAGSVWRIGFVANPLSFDFFAAIIAAPFFFFFAAIVVAH